MTSSASDLFSPWSVRTVSDSELLTTGVVSSVEQSAPQRVYNTRGYSTDRVGQEPGELSYRPRRQDRRVSASSHGTSPALAAFARHRNIGEGRQHGDADTRRQSSVTTEDLTHRRPDVAASASRQRAVDIVSGSSSQTGTGSLLTEQRRSLYTGTTDINNLSVASQQCAYLWCYVLCCTESVLPDSLKSSHVTHNQGRKPGTKCGRTSCAGGLGDRSPPVGSRGEAPVGGLGDEVPQSINQSINIRLIKVVRRNLKQLKYWQCIHSIK